MKKNLFHEIFEKLKQPWKFLAFNLYFIFIVILVGGIDIFYSVKEQYDDGWKEIWDITKNMSAYGLALIAASLVDVLLNSIVENRRSMIILSMATVLFAFVLFNWSYSIKSKFAFFPATIIVILGLITWILANHNNNSLREEFFDEVSKGVEKHNSNWENS